jgi:hypothetical protein
MVLPHRYAVPPVKAAEYKKTLMGGSCATPCSCDIPTVSSPLSRPLSSRVNTIPTVRATAQTGQPPPTPYHVSRVGRRRYMFYPHTRTRPIIPPCLCLCLCFLLPVRRWRCRRCPSTTRTWTRGTGTCTRTVSPTRPPCWGCVSCGHPTSPARATRRLRPGQRQ